MCGGLVAYECTGGDKPGHCCPPAIATVNTYRNPASGGICTRVEKIEEVVNAKNDDGSRCSKAMETIGDMACIFPEGLISEFGLVDGCDKCGGLTAYHCTGGDIPGACCPPALATSETEGIRSFKDSSIINKCTRADTEEDIVVLAEKM